MLQCTIISNFWHGFLVIVLIIGLSKIIGLIWLSYVDYGLLWKSNRNQRYRHFHQIHTQWNSEDEWLLVKDISYFNGSFLIIKQLATNLLFNWINVWGKCEPSVGAIMNLKRIEGYTKASDECQYVTNPVHWTHGDIRTLNMYIYIYNTAIMLPNFLCLTIHTLLWSYPGLFLCLTLQLLGPDAGVSGSLTVPVA